MKKTLALFTPALIMSTTLFTGAASAHGWVEFPSARQNTCYLDGGFWTGNLPNQACQQAFEKSGAYPFVQRNEVAINIPDFNNMNAVKAAVPDGTLCSAGTQAKAGLNIPSVHWQKTVVNLDENNQFELVFMATAPHNPSFWQFYLSNEAYDASTALGWDDVTLVNSVGNVVVGDDGRYRITITLPAERNGDDAVLFTRWQRNDAAGEGFYNCSDITIASGTDNTNPDTGEPTEHGNENLTDIGYFMGSDFPEADLNDTVRFRTFSAEGDETTDVELTITESNLNTWPAVLAAKFNEQKQDEWFIGIWHTAMNHYMFDSNNPHANKVFTSFPTSSYQLSLIKAVDTTPPVVDPNSTWVADAVYNEGDIVIHNNIEWTAQWWTKQDEPGTSAVWKGKDPSNDQGTEAWSDSLTYNEGDKVLHNGKEWTAQWWTQKDEPGTTGQWGVWR